MRLAVSGGVEPRTYTGTARQKGVVIWRCNHAHRTKEEAQACGAAQAELMSQCIDVRCLCCKQPVMTFLEHFSPGTGDYTCREQASQARKSHRRIR